MSSFTLSSGTRPTPKPFRYQNDKRFAFDLLPSDRPGQIKYRDPKGDVSYASPETAVPWVDLDLNTQMGDMRSIVQGHSGTSEGDAWAPSDIQIVRQLAVQNGGKVNANLVNLYKKHLLANKDPHFMSTHPGKAAYNVR